MALFMAFCANVALAQGDIDTEKKVLFPNEWSLAAVMKTNGLELDYRSGKFVSVVKKNLWDCGFGFMKHPQQYRVTNASMMGFGQFCYAKTNFCCEFFGSVGRQRTLFHKADLNSVEVRMFYFGGVDLALLKKNYYEIYHDASDIRSEEFDPINQYALVTLGKSDFTKGFSETKAVPGVNAKMGLSVEFGKRNTRLNALEAGVKFSAFAKKLDIMGQKRNPQFLCNLFASVRFGKIKHGWGYEYDTDSDD